MAQLQYQPRDYQYFGQFKEAWIAAVNAHEYDFPSIIKEFVSAIVNIQGILDRLGQWPGDDKLARVIKDADNGLDVLDGMDIQDLAVVLFHEAAAQLKKRQQQSMPQ